MQGWLRDLDPDTFLTQGCREEHREGDIADRKRACCRWHIHSGGGEKMKAFKKLREMHNTVRDRGERGERIQIILIEFERIQNYR